MYDSALKKKWNSFPLECPDLMFNPQCVPAEKYRYVLMFPLSGKLYPSVLKHVHERTCAHLHIFLLKKKNSAIIPICYSLLHQSPFLVSQRSKKKKKKDHCHFFSLVNETSIFLWLSICNPLWSKNRCSGLLWTCKAAEPNPKSGCDVLYVFGLMHILLAKRRYRHSPPI